MKRPSTSPSTSPSIGPKPTPIPTSSKPTTDDVTENAPLKRFTQWGELEESDLSIAENRLGYIKYSWNVLGENEIEESRYSDLNPDKAAAVNDLGMTSDQWDCWVNHYNAYLWLDLKTMGISTHLQALGWTQSMWEGNGNLPATEDLYWNELTASEQTAAKQICYTEFLWDGVSLKKW